MVIKEDCEFCGGAFESLEQCPICFRRYCEKCVDLGVPMRVCGGCDQLFCSRHLTRCDGREFCIECGPDDSCLETIMSGIANIGKDYWLTGKKRKSERLIMEFRAQDWPTLEVHVLLEND